ncbi:UbiA family prenyltransferase [Chitinophaga defluvii]|uniref:UbiA family prenyltransferase n=1 Tax=Chitinophaga defluvii TaxID=3163343 RepID=A0ABV2T5V3_9BACT
MLKASTIQLLRFPFSWLLLPVYLFALSMAGQVNWWYALGSFILIHLLLYPASNGYNSYMDRDEGSIGGVKDPMAPTRELYVVSGLMDIAGAVLALTISMNFALCYVIYIIFSRLYSYRGVRLKQYPLTGYLTVVLNQGALVFYMVYVNVSKTGEAVPWQGLVISTLLIGAFYPITQIYQHDQDRKDGVTTISYRLGVRGTFLYCGSLYLAAFALLAIYLHHAGHFGYFIILQVWYLPVIVLFLRWAWQCWQDKSAADFQRTMRMNWVAATCTNMAFISVIIYKHFG